jgi:peroxiredoxin
MPKHSEEKKVAEIGEEAPMFELKDQHGKTHKLSDYKGKIVVLEWFNERCPYCKGVWASGLISKTLTDLGKLDSEVVYLTMNSTANRPEEDVLESGAEFIEEMEVEVPMLMDYNGKVGRAYGARTTPHMFVIDAEGVLVYQGAISDDQRNKEGEKAETHVMRAINQLNAGEEVSPSYVQPWGCSVKYARGGKQDHPKRPRRPASP